MEIPKQPSSSQNTSTKTSPIGPSASSNPIPPRPLNDSELLAIPLKDASGVRANTVSVEELTVPVGQKILARVIGEVKGQNLIIGRDIQLPSEGKPALIEARNSSAFTALTGTPATNKSAPQQWLLQVGQQYLLTQTSAPLVSGGLLNVRLNTDLTLSLIPQTEVTGKLSQSELITALRNALGKALPEQVSLQTGLSSVERLAKQISNVNETIAASTALTGTEANKTRLLAKLIVEQIGQSLPETNSLMRGYEQLLQGSAKRETGEPLLARVKQWLTDSGINLEASMLNDLRSGRQADANTLSRLEQTLWPVLGKVSQLPIKEQSTWFSAASALLRDSSINPQSAIEQLKSLYASTPKAPRSAGEQSVLQGLERSVNEAALHRLSMAQLFDSANSRPELVNNQRLLASLAAAASGYEKASLELTQQAQNLLNLVQRTDSGSTSKGPSETLIQQTLTNLISPSTPDTSDLKALLHKTIHAIALSRAGEQAVSGKVNEALLASELKGVGETSLLRTPFEFPRLETSLLKAQAILADQELTTGQLLRLLAGMIQRIQFNQANSLYQAQVQSEPSIAQSFFMELPYTHAQQINTLQLRIDQHEEEESKTDRNKKAKTRQWTIELSFNLDHIGPLHVRAELTPPNFKASIWVDSSSAKQQVLDEQERLLKRLSEAGLSVDEFHCRIGRPESRAQTHIKQGFVDIQA